MKFQGTAGAEKGPEKGPIAAASAAPFWLSSGCLLARVFVTATRARRAGRRGKMQTSGPRALSDPDHDVAHRLAGLDRLMRRHDVAEVEALRHVVDELAGFEHARDLGGRAGALLRRHQVDEEKLHRDAVLQQELEGNRRRGRAAAIDR